MPADRAQDDPRHALGDPTYGPDRVGAEGGGVRGVGLPDEPRQVDLVVEDDHRAEPPGRAAYRDLYGREQVRRAVGSGQRGVAHRARHHHRRLAVHQEIQDERRLLYGVGPLRDDRPRRAAVDPARDLRRKLDEVLHPELARRRLAERHGRHLGDPGYLGHVRDQRLAGQRRLDPLAPGVHRRDGPPHRENRYPRKPHRSSLRVRFQPIPDLSDNCRATGRGALAEGCGQAAGRRVERGARVLVQSVRSDKRGREKGEGSMAEKEIFCSIGIDIDAVAGWLGSYGGEDSPDDISRGMFSGEVGTPRLLKLFEKYDLQDHVVYPGALHRDVPGSGQDGGRRGARGREPRLLAREPGGDDAAAGAGRAREEHRAHRGSHRQGARGQRRAVVGGLERLQRPACSSTATSTTTPCSTGTSRPTTRARATRGPRSTTPRPPRSG